MNNEPAIGNGGGFVRLRLDIAYEIKGMKWK